MGTARIVLGEAWEPDFAGLELSPATAIAGLRKPHHRRAGSDEYARHNPRNTWQALHWDLFSPRVGVAYSPTDKLVIRSGYGLAYLPNTVAFSLGPYNSPVNNSITPMTASLDGGLTPNLGATLSNPFPTGIAAPPGRSQAYPE